MVNESPGQKPGDPEILCRQRQLFKTIEMIVGRTELVFDHCGALEIMADRQLLRDADAAMRLYRILAHELRCLGNFRLAG